MERIPASERTREKLRTLIQGRGEAAEERSELVRQPEIHRERHRARRPDQKRDVLQHHRDAEAGDDDAHPGKRNSAALTGQPPGPRALLLRRPDFFLEDRRELGDG